MVPGRAFDRLNHLQHETASSISDFFDPGQRRTLSRPNVPHNIVHRDADTPAVIGNERSIIEFNLRLVPSRPTHRLQ